MVDVASSVILVGIVVAWSTITLKHEESLAGFIRAVSWRAALWSLAAAMLVALWSEPAGDTPQLVAKLSGSAIQIICVAVIAHAIQPKQRNIMAHYVTKTIPSAFRTGRSRSVISAKNVAARAKLGLDADISQSNSAFSLEGRLFAVALLTALIVVPFVSLAAIASISVGEDINPTGFRVLIGYNSLATISMLTLAAACTVGLHAVLHFFGFTSVRPAVARYFGTVAGWTGYGTVGGIILIALTVPLSVVVPNGFRPYEGSGWTAQHLIDFSAAGAILGYGTGLIASLPTLLADAKSALFRNLLAPVVFSVSMLMLAAFGITPRTILNGMLADSGPIPPTTCSNVLGASQWDGDQGALFRTIEHCGDGMVYLSDSAAISLAVTLACIVGIIMAIRDLRASTPRIRAS